MSNVDVFAYVIIGIYTIGFVMRRLAAFIKIPDTVLENREMAIAIYWVGLALVTAMQVWAVCHALRFA